MRSGCGTWFALSREEEVQGVLHHCLKLTERRCREVSAAVAELRGQEDMLLRQDKEDSG